MQITVLSSRAIRKRPDVTLSHGLPTPVLYMTELLTSDTLSTLEGWPISCYLFLRTKLGKELV